MGEIAGGDNQRSASSRDLGERVERRGHAGVVVRMGVSVREFVKRPAQNGQNRQILAPREVSQPHRRQLYRMFARVMQLLVVSGFSNGALQPSERVRVRRQLALRRGVALARGRDSGGRAVVIRAENDGELDVVKIALRHSPQLGVSGVSALVIYMRADHRDEIAARLGRGRVGRETPRPLIELRGQLAGV